MKKRMYVNLLIASLGAGCGGGASEVPTFEQSGTAYIGPAATPLDEGLHNPALSAGKSYSFTKVAAFGETTPSGEQLTSYFVPYGLNDVGDAFFQSQTASGTAIFRMPHGKPTEQFAGPGKSAPGGGTYTDGVMSLGTALNQHGDGVFKFLLDKSEAESLPYGLHQGVFRVDAGSADVTVIRPGVTLAPNGQPFEGSHMYSGINADRVVVFGGIIHTSKGIKIPGEPDSPLGMGVFTADAAGNIRSIVSPGDPAPGKKVFDFAENGFINDHGDVAFGAHIAGESCTTFGLKQAERIFCGESVYLYRKASGRIVSIAHQGESAPGGGKYNLAFGPAINNSGDVVFIGDFSTAPDILTNTGVFLWSRGSTIAIARSGDSLPGGGKMVSASGYVQGYSLNDRGEVFFFATIDTDRDGDGQNDSGVFVWKDGVTRTIVRTGQKLAGLGTVSLISFGQGFGSAVSNNHGEVLTFVTTTAGNGYLVKATSK